MGYSIIELFLRTEATHFSSRPRRSMVIQQSWPNRVNACVAGKAIAFFNSCHGGASACSVVSSLPSCEHGVPLRSAALRWWHHPFRGPVLLSREPNHAVLNMQGIPLVRRQDSRRCAPICTDRRTRVRALESKGLLCATACCGLPHTKQEVGGSGGFHQTCFQVTVQVSVRVSEVVTPNAIPHPSLVG